ncbi:MAG: ankyrin repeat domain-containing protein [Deltaproteobacteria bacterium]|nr:ankyrin repeat domain-containing protein [Deltaproteobacteria bacterium]
MNKTCCRKCLFTAVTTVCFLLSLAGPSLAMRTIDSRLLSAAQKGDEKKVVQLLKKGADVKAKDDGGNTALHLAATPKIASTLIAAGASVHARNADFDMTPIFSASAGVAKVLTAHGANVNEKARKGMTPLTWAVYWNQKQKLELLIEHGAYINAGDDDGRTALQTAANWDKIDLVKLLLAKGADINAKDNVCWTALHWAAFEASPNMMALLIASGADVNALSCPAEFPGQTPCDVAGKYRSPDIAAYLQSKGCRSAGESP